MPSARARARCSGYKVASKEKTRWHAADDAGTVKTVLAASQKRCPQAERGTGGSDQGDVCGNKSVQDDAPMASSLRDTIMMI